MESLSFYIKERKPFFALYIFFLVLNIVLIIYDIYRFTSGYIDATMLRFLIRSAIFIPVFIKFFGYVKKFYYVCIDYKKPQTETKTVYVKSQGSMFCMDKSNGAYMHIFCSESFEGKKTEYWIYKKNLMYDVPLIGKQYEITYYKNSKCLCSIHAVFDDLTNPNKLKKSVVIQKKKRLDKIYEKKELVIVDCNKKVVTEKVTTLGIPYSTELEDRIIAGVPNSIYYENSKNRKLFLKVQNEKGKKKNLILYSTDILGLGDLEERPGYKGYGNFIGMKYEVEYYKCSRVIKSMRIIDQPIVSDGSMIEP